MRVAILGPFGVQNDAGDTLSVTGARLRDLVIRLALAGGKPVSTSALAEAVWGDDPPADLPNALQTLVSRARRSLGGAETVEQSAAGYRLAVVPDDVDALRFQRLVADGAIEEALALWRGPALADAGEFAAPYALRLDELRLDATLSWLERRIADGWAGGHVAEIEALAAENPLNERVAALQMRALATAGRQADALEFYEALRGRLSEELGIDPGQELQAVHLEVLRGKIKSGDRHPHRVRTNLRSQLTSFVGRGEDVVRVGQALDAHRLVTLVGPGGAGKTRLASEVAARVTTEAVDGVWMTELASVTDAADVPQAVLASIGLRETRLMPDGGSHLISTRDARTRLLEGLADSRTLLVLDNCEHLIDACAHLADALLAHSPRLRIVATSREPLGITGESLFVVPPLATDPAVQLFADRAAAASPGFAVTEDNLPFVVEIVSRLDGLPLAIELAAARLRTLPLAEISRRLDDRFRLLTGGSRTALPRHRTLRAVVEWSWELLTLDERLLAERFSVFPAGATPEAVAEICGDLSDTDELLSSLVDKSLLQPVTGGTRLRMLETIREFGAERLAVQSDAAKVRRRHAIYYCDLMIESGPKLLTRDQLTWLAVVRDDWDNVLAALRYWCDARDASRAITLALWLSTVAFLLGNHADISDWIAAAVAVPGESDPNLRTVADTLYIVSRSINAGDQLELTLPELADRIEALDPESFPLAGLLRPAYAFFLQDEALARRYIDEAMASRNEWLVAATWMMSAALAENTGDRDRLRISLEEALRRFRVLGERWGLSSALRVASGARMADGDLDGAEAAMTEAIRVLDEMGSRDDEAQAQLRIAEITVRRGDLDRASQLYEEARAAAESQGAADNIALVSMSSALFEAMRGNAGLARSYNATARHWFEQLSPGHPAREHVIALVSASDLLIALDGADIPLAREHAAEAYRAGLLGKDMPVVAVVGGVLAHLAHALGQSERAAEMLGACVPVRGGEDVTDPIVKRLERELRAALGADVYTRAYDRGKALSRAEAMAILDPAGLADLRPPHVPAQRQREEHHQQHTAAGERQADLPRGRPAEHQVTYRGDQVRDRVHLHEGLQPAGQRRG
jgi:predicted ATPase/DNA-binding SARP family transcriptional activator